MYALRPPPFVSLFLFSHINSPPHPLLRCLFPCHSAVIPRFCAGSAFPRSSGRALRFVSTITAIHESLKPLNYPYKARPAEFPTFRVGNTVFIPVFSLLLFSLQGHICFVYRFFPLNPWSYSTHFLIGSVCFVCKSDIFIKVKKI